MLVRNPYSSLTPNHRKTLSQLLFLTLSLSSHFCTSPVAYSVLPREPQYMSNKPFYMFLVCTWLYQFLHPNQTLDGIYVMTTTMDTGSRVSVMTTTTGLSSLALTCFLTLLPAGQHALWNVADKLVLFDALLCAVVDELYGASVTDLTNPRQSFQTFSNKNLRLRSSLNWHWVICFNPDLSIYFRLNCDFQFQHDLWLTLGSGNNSCSITIGCVYQPGIGLNL